MHINIDRPTRGLAVDMRYDEAISRLRLMDFASRGDGGHISDDSAARSIHYRYDGWLFPRAGLVYAWTLTAEAGVRRRSSTPDAPAAPQRQSERVVTHAASLIRRLSKAPYADRVWCDVCLILSSRPWWPPPWLFGSSRIHSLGIHDLWIVRTAHERAILLYG